MKRGRSTAFFLFILAAIIGFSSCNVEKNRKLLSVFFDGVPEKKSENLQKTEKIEVVRNNKKRYKPKPFISSHPDYAKRECSKCHTKEVSNFLKTDKKKLCFTCHKEEKFDSDFIHGPVAVRACGVCHEPHQSVNRKLLKAEGRALCDLCHKTPVPGVSIPSKGDNCLECHEPHAADNKYLLKKGISTDIPPDHMWKPEMDRNIKENEAEKKK